MLGLASITSYFRFSQPAPTTQSTNTSQPTIPEHVVTPRDPESLLTPPESRARRDALLRAQRKKDTQGKERDFTIKDVLYHFFAQAEKEAKENENEFSASVNRLNAVKNISIVKPGDYSAKFANGEMLNVGINFAADAASVASSMAVAFGLVKWLAPNSTMGSVPSTLQGPGNVPSPVAAAGYIWKDMGYTSILAGSPFLMREMFKSGYLGAAQAYLLKGRHDPVSAMEENFNNYLKQEYEPFKEDISEDVKVAVEKIISRVLSLYDDLRPDKTKQTNMQLNDITKTRAFIGMAEYWLKSFLPLAKNGLPLMEVPGWRDRDETLKKMLETEKLLRIPRPLSKSQALHLPLSQGCRSVEKSEYVIPNEMLERPMKDTRELTAEDDIRDWHHWLRVEDIPQKQTMFVGKTGGGKSFIKKILKAIWDTPSYDQTYQPLSQGGVAAGDAAKWRAAYQTEYITREGDLLSERVFKMFVAQYRNAMRYLDEPSWEDREGAKRDTDPYVEKLYSECIEASYRILESCTTVMTNTVVTVDNLLTTEEIIQDIDPTFLSRFELIVLGDCDPEDMRDISKQAYKALASRFCLPFKDGIPAEGEEQKIIPAKLDDDQQSRLLSAFLSVLDKLVEHHAEKKGELRMYTDVEPIFMEIVSRLILEKDPGHKRMENADIQQWVEDYFEVMPNRNAYSKKTALDKGKAPENEFHMLMRERDQLQRELVALRNDKAANEKRQEEIRALTQPLDQVGLEHGGNQPKLAGDARMATERSVTDQTPTQHPPVDRRQVSKRKKVEAWLRRSIHPGAWNQRPAA